jgi:hypothetical protein
VSESEIEIRTYSDRPLHSRGIPSGDSTGQDDGWGKLEAAVLTGTVALMVLNPLWTIWTMVTP